jgi:hypothetical protein
MITNHKPQRSCVVTNTVKRVITTIDTMEIVEEYDLKTDLLVLRKLRRNRFTNTPWEVEVGIETVKNALIRTSAGQPTLTRLDTKTDFVWRIDQMVYPKETYQINLDGNTIKVTTTNKKY